MMFTTRYVVTTKVVTIARSCRRSWLMDGRATAIIVEPRGACAAARSRPRTVGPARPTASGAARDDAFTPGRRTEFPPAPPGGLARCAGSWDPRGGPDPRGSEPTRHQSV